MVYGLPKYCGSAQEMAVLFYPSSLQKSRRDAPQAQSLTVIGGEYADPLSEDLKAMRRGYQSRETHLTSKEIGNRGA